MKIQNVFDKTIKIIMAALFSWIIVLLFLAKNIDYYVKREFIISNIIIIIVSLSFITLYMILKKEKIKYRQINYDKLVKRLVLILFFVQLYIFYNIFFETGWDAHHVADSARKIAYGESIASYPMEYFSYFTNNRFITLLFSLILKINSIIGIFPNDYDLMSIITINCLISSYTSYLIYKIGTQLFSRRLAFVGYLISVVMIVLSHWNVICYSDSFGLLFPILILRIYLKKTVKYQYKYPAIILLGYISYLMKPQSALILIAIIIVEIIKNISKIQKVSIKKILIVLIPSLIMIFLINISYNQIAKHYQLGIDSEKDLGFTHYLMEGVNDETNGGYLTSDNWYSMSFSTKKERKEKNLMIFNQRLEKLGISGYLKLLSKKLLSSYNDGTFAWAAEGEFFYITKNDINKLSKELKDTYYVDGNKYSIYSSILQFIWINIIVIIFINSIIVLFKKSSKIDYINLILVLTIIGLTMFELLFEVRSRYLYTNLPIFILLMLYGVHNISNLNFHKFKKSKFFKQKKLQKNMI